MTNKILIGITILVGLALTGLTLSYLGANAFHAGVQGIKTLEEFGKSNTIESSAIVGAHLPTPSTPPAVRSKKLEEFRSGALLLDIENACIWELGGGKKAFYVPVAPNLLEKGIQALGVNPNTEERVTAPPELLRYSIWYMPIGEKMIMGALFQDQGMALVYIKRLSEDRYRRSIESVDGQVLEVREGVLERVDPSIGYGRLKLGPPLEGERILAQGCYECEWWFWSFYAASLSKG